MRICFVNEEYPEETNFGGIATYQKLMCEELVRQGHTVYVVCRGLKKSYTYRENGVIVYRIFVKDFKNKTFASIIYRKKIKNILLNLQDKLDIIETPDWGANTIYFEKYRKVPLVVRLHTPLKIWLKYNKNTLDREKRKILKWEDKILRVSDRITSCSCILKNIVKDEYNLSKDITVIPNPANTKDFYQDSSIEKENLLLFVGSLEERKGVFVLAKALNEIFNKYPKMKFMFIGKDTNRNKYNISTKEVLLKIIDKKYHNRVEFLGQIKNSSLNYYFNKAAIAIFPSLFDNFPYVVLEAMATGIYIVGSKNSGMVDMLDDDSAIYETGNYKSLVEKIIAKYNDFLGTKINSKNIERVNLFNAKLICKKMVDLYRDTIKKYNQDIISKNILEEVLSNVTSDNKILFYKREYAGVANYVYRVYTRRCKYIIKKYIYDYDYDLANVLYDTYQKEGIEIIRPLNSKIINYKEFSYNIFEYKKVSHFKRNFSQDYIKRLLTCNRKVDIKDTVTAKCNKYYLYLKNNQSNLVIRDEVNDIISLYEKISNNKLFKEQYINHGDISLDNVIYSRGKYYIIDFDEVNVSSFLYDFAVVIIKLCVRNDKINMQKYNYFKEEVKKRYSEYTDFDFYISIKYYLCKILLEKFYFYGIGKIDLFSKEQKRDNFVKYIKILESFDKEEKYE